MSTGCTLCGLLIQIPYISFQSSGMHRKEHFLTFTFRVLSSPLFRFSSLPQFFFLFSHLAGFILVGKVFRKAFRILGLDERKGRKVVEQNFQENFQVNVTCIIGFFLLVFFRSMLHDGFCLFLWCPCLNCAHSGMV